MTDAEKLDWLHRQIHRIGFLMQGVLPEKGLRVTDLLDEALVVAFDEKAVCPYDDPQVVADKTSNYQIGRGD